MRAALRIVARAAGLVAALLVAGFAVFAFWPVQLGGWTAYAVIDGDSMEPRLHSGDLVLTRTRGDYTVGDTVLYRTADGANVFHRIVADRGGTFTVRGDNMAVDDPKPVTRSDVVGAGWIVVPGAGRSLDWLGQPVNLGIVLFVLVLLGLGVGRALSRRRTGDDGAAPAARHGRWSSTGHVATGRSLLAAGLLGAVLFGALTALAWSREPTVTEIDENGYAHSGTFAYEARAPRSAAYPDGRVVTGQPLFLDLARVLEISFDYAFSSTTRFDTRGSIGLDAIVSDGEGWTRRLSLAPVAPFTGTTASVEGRLDVDRVSTIVERLRGGTRAPVPVVTLSIVPRVSLAGYVGKRALDEQFTPALTFTLDDVALRLALPEEASIPTADPTGAIRPLLTPRQEGSIDVARAAELALGPLSLEVSRARSVALIGLALSLAAVGLGVALSGILPSGSAADRIHARYPSRIVRARATVPDGRVVTELQDVDGLMRIAESYDRIVLRVVEPDGGDAFLVDDGVALYRFRPEPAGVTATAITLPAH